VLGSLVAVVLALLTPAAFPQPQTAAIRVEVPIREVVLSDGVRRYGVPVKIGSQDALAGLDTGASGLRLMPDAPGRGDERQPAGATA
jgi:hypothetical protein